MEKWTNGLTDIKNEIDRQVGERTDRQIERRGKADRLSINRMKGERQAKDIPI